MEIKAYNIEKFTNDSYRFYSEGPNGKFELRIVFSPLVQDFYNLGFGVYNALTDDIDDKIQTRNGDMDTILATVAQTAIEFLAERRSAYLLASGSTGIRTRKYQMGIGQYLQELTQSHSVRGFIADRDAAGNTIGQWPSWDGEWFEFRNGINYDAFLLYLK